MKKAIFILTAVCLGLILQAQSASFQKFKNAHQHDANVLHLAIPGWVFDLVQEHQSEVKTDAIKQAVERCQLLIFSGQNDALNQDFKELRTGLKKEGYDVLLHINEGQQGILLLGIDQNADAWQNLILLIDGGQEAIALNLHGLFNQNMLKDFKIENLKH